MPKIMPVMIPRKHCFKLITPYSDSMSELQWKYTLIVHFQHTLF